MASVIPVIAKHYASSSNNKTNIDGTPQDSGTFTDGQVNFFVMVVFEVNNLSFLLK